MRGRGGDGWERQAQARTAAPLRVSAAAVAAQLAERQATACPRSRLAGAPARARLLS